jgi:hypothetical protein
MVIRFIFGLLNSYDCLSGEISIHCLLGWILSEIRIENWGLAKASGFTAQGPMAVTALNLAIQHLNQLSSPRSLSHLTHHDSK